VRVQEIPDIAAVVAIVALAALFSVRDVAASDADQPPLRRGSKHAITIKPGALACRSLDDHRALIQLLTDQSAATEFVNKVLLKDGRCVLWAKGTDVFIDNEATVSSPRDGHGTLFVCVRPVGDTNCRWVTHWTLR
jgi:hypothetical protein